ncbi:MAG: immunoglobulin-like domain-containing protein [Crocinitomicaceae bacterium]
MKNLFILTIALFSIANLSSCKKKGCTDNTATNYNSKAKKDDGSCLYVPTITIIGASDTTISVGASYSDPGATAVNKDGSSVDVVTENNVNSSTTGSYEVNYSATNANGTATAQRTVKVIIGAENWTGPTWSVSSTCSGSQFPLSNSPTIAAGGGANEVTIDPFFNVIGGTASGTINGAAISIPQQTIVSQFGDINFSGTGTMNSSGTQIQITYTYDNTIPLIGGQGTCMAIYDKQ